MTKPLLLPLAVSHPPPQLPTPAAPRRPQLRRHRGLDCRPCPWLLSLWGSCANKRKCRLPPRRSSGHWLWRPAQSPEPRGRTEHLLPAQNTAGGTHRPPRAACASLGRPPLDTGPGADCHPPPFRGKVHLGRSKGKSGLSSAEIVHQGRTSQPTKTQPSPRHGPAEAPLA